MILRTITSSEYQYDTEKYHFYDIFGFWSVAVNIMYKLLISIVKPIFAIFARFEHVVVLKFHRNLNGGWNLGDLTTPWMILSDFHCAFAKVVGHLISRDIFSGNVNHFAIVDAQKWQYFHFRSKSWYYCLSKRHQFYVKAIWQHFRQFLTFFFTVHAHKWQLVNFSVEILTPSLKSVTPVY